MTSYALNLLRHRPLVSVCVLWFVTLFTVLYVFKEGLLCEKLVDSLSQRGYIGSMPSQPMLASNGEADDEDDRSACNYGRVDLVPLRKTKEYDGGNQEDKVFLLETSGRPHLSPRQACSVESAARFSELKTVIVMMWSPYVDLSDPTTCKLVRNFKNVKFHRIDLELDYKDTPLYDLYQDGKILNSKHVTTHLSDSLRLAYLFKFGGWYSDLDYVFIRSMKGLRNVLVATLASEKAAKCHLNNGMMNLDKKHMILKQYLKLFAKKFKGEGRAEVGPMTLTKVVKEQCERSLKPDELLYNLTKANKCYGLEVKHPDYFHPFRPYEMKELWPSEKGETRTEEQWNDRLSKALAVHFFSFMTKGKKVSGDPSKDLFSYLAPKYCPVSYDGNPSGFN